MSRPCNECLEPTPECECPDGPTTASDGDRIACPWCGHRNRDLWEYGDGGEADDVEADCGECDRTYLLSRHVSVSYTARRGTGVLR